MAEPPPKQEKVYARAAFFVGLVTVVYWIARAFEPLRLDWGDPWSDANVLTTLNYSYRDGFLRTSFTDVLDVGPLTAESYRYTHYPPLAEIFYGAVHKVVGDADIGAYRLFAIGFSALALFALFRFARRVWSARIAALAVLFWCASFFWHMYADSMHQAPIMQAAGLGALSAVAAYLDDAPRKGRLLLLAAALTYATYLVSYDYIFFLPLSVAFLGMRKGHWPLQRPMRPLLLALGGGALLAVATKAAFVSGALGWHEFVKDVAFQFLERATVRYSEDYRSGFAQILLLRTNAIFSPAFMPGLLVLVARFAVLRRKGAILGRDWQNPIWLLFAALPLFAVFSQLAVSQVLASQVLMPVFAVGLGYLVDLALQREARWGPAFGVVLALAVVGHQGFQLARFPWSYLPRADARSVRDFLKQQKKGDFVLSNIANVGVVQYYFETHLVPPAEMPDPEGAAPYYQDLFQKSGVERIYHVHFTDPRSRFIDKCIWPLFAYKSGWSALGDPFGHRDEVLETIEASDARVLRALERVHAKKVFSAPGMDVYEIDRAHLDPIGEPPAETTRRIDFGLPSFRLFKIDGFYAPQTTERGAPFAFGNGHEDCIPAERCRTVLTKTGLEFRGTKTSPEGRFRARLPAKCGYEAKLRYFRILPEQRLSVVVNGTKVFEAPDSPDLEERDVVFRIPKEALAADGLQTVGLGFRKKHAEWGTGIGFMWLTFDPEPGCTP